MEVKLKNIELSKENRQDVTGFGNTMDLYIKRLNKLQKLQDDNCSDIEYCENIFSMYEVRFDDDYMDVVKFMNAKKGTILTNIPCYYNGVWTFMSYDIAYYELDLEHVYIKEEIDFLAKSGKIVLLSSKPYISVDYQESFDGINGLDTIENYDFSNLNNNGLENNNLVISMIKSLFGYSKLKESIDSEKNHLIEMLQSYRNHALQMGAYYNYNTSSYNELAQVCANKIKKIVKKSEI